MEAVLESTVPFPGVFAIPWKRIFRGCLILLLSGVLFLYAQNYAQSNEVVLGGEMLHGRQGFLDRNSIPDACEQVKNSIRNPAKERLIIQEELSGKITADLNLPEESKTVENGNLNAIGNIETADKNGGMQSGLIIEEIPPIVDDVPADHPEEDVRLGSSVISVPSADEEPANQENTYPRECNGFLVDEEGYIVGCAANLTVVDDILVIPADEKCIGIRKDALSDLGQDVMEVFIPANITDIETGAFDVLPYLMYIEVAAENPCYYSIDGVLYTISGDTLIYPAGR